MELEGDNIPSFPQLKMLPNLTHQQREAARMIFEDSKKEIEARSSELKALKKQRDPSMGNMDITQSMQSPERFPSPDELRRVQQIRQDIRQIRTLAWEKTKLLLTEKNLKDLESMRKGELVPPLMPQPLTENADVRPEQNMFDSGRSPSGSSGFSDCPCCPPATKK